MPARAFRMRGTALPIIGRPGRSKSGASASLVSPSPSGVGVISGTAVARTTGVGVGVNVGNGVGVGVGRAVGVGVMVGVGVGVLVGTGVIVGVGVGVLIGVGVGVLVGAGGGVFVGTGVIVGVGVGVLVGVGVGALPTCTSSSSSLSMSASSVAPSAVDDCVTCDGGSGDRLRAQPQAPVVYQAAPVALPADSGFEFREDSPPGCCRSPTLNLPPDRCWRRRRFHRLPLELVRVQELAPA